MKIFFRLALTLSFTYCILACGTFAQAKERTHTEPSQHPDTYDALIAKQAKRHGVPEALIHRIIVRESRYRPDAFNRIYYGLMQITYATARGMGYKGEPHGLLDAETNLTYAVPYLANAYIVANKNPDRAVTLYASGYYFEAKRQHKLDLMRTASSEPVTPPAPVVVAAAPEPPANPVSQLFHALTTPLRPVPPPVPVQTAAAPEAAPLPTDKAHQADASSASTASTTTLAAATKPTPIVRRSSARKKTISVKKVAKNETTPLINAPAPVAAATAAK